MKRPTLLTLAAKAEPPNRGPGGDKTSWRRCGEKQKNATPPRKINSDARYAIEARVVSAVESQLVPSLRRVINATGVILHTNLGRAPLSANAAAEIAETATRYSNLEYDISSGERGRRDIHTAQRAGGLAGAEAAVVVNNNAAAVFLVLNTLAKGAEVIVSRGELIEIGDGFRIPDIMSESGAVLREVGTTNRTRIRDYERAFNERTRLLLRVHPSNFHMTGFTERPSLEGTRCAWRADAAAGLRGFGFGMRKRTFPPAASTNRWRAASCDAGVSVVSFSADKLLGGPQAGIIAGAKEFIERLRGNPLFRALRVDKLTIAALEVTLRAYARGLFDEIPTLRMIRLSADDIADRAHGLLQPSPSIPAGWRGDRKCGRGFLSSAEDRHPTSNCRRT